MFAQRLAGRSIAGIARELTELAPYLALAGHGDLGAGHADRIGPRLVGHAVEQPPQWRGSPRADRDLHPANSAARASWPAK